MEKAKKIIKTTLIIIIIGVLVYVGIYFVLTRINWSNNTDISPLVTLSPEVVANFEDIMRELDQIWRENPFPEYRELLLPSGVDSIVQFRDLPEREWVVNEAATATIRLNLPDNISAREIIVPAFSSVDWSLSILFLETSAEAEAYLSWRQGLERNYQALKENENDTSILLFYGQYLGGPRHWRRYEVSSIVRIGNGVFTLHGRVRVRNAWDYNVISAQKEIHSIVIEVFCEIITEAYTNMHLD